MADDQSGQLNSGEVVLVETRQHWVAAIRFALRPIVIALRRRRPLAPQWLARLAEDSFFDIINDLVGWIVILLLVVAVVWLPIDLGAVVHPQVRAHESPRHALVRHDQEAFP